MRTSIRLLLVLATLTLSSAIPQETPEQLGQQVRRRIAEITKSFPGKDADKEVYLRYVAGRDSATLRIQSEIDAYIRMAFDPAQASSQTLERNIRAALADHKPNEAYGDLALARVGNLTRGRSLVVAYTIVKPPHHDLPTIRGYRAAEGRFELVAMARPDFTTFNMFKTEIRSPIDGEIWLLAWGQEHTANGRYIRLRLFAFDGARFRTMWSPDILFNADVKVVDQGFVIEHIPFRKGYKTRDEYALTPAGPVLTRSVDQVP
jgi:hypothetical protein